MKDYIHRAEKLGNTCLVCVLYIYITNLEMVQLLKDMKPQNLKEIVKHRDDNKFKFIERHLFRKRKYVLQKQIKFFFEITTGRGYQC